MKRRRLTERIRLFAAVLLASLPLYSDGESEIRTAVASTDYVEEGTGALELARVAFYRDFLVRNPDIELVPFRTIHLPPAIVPSWQARVSFAMLGDAGPDHIVSSPEDWHVLFEHRFLYPLDEYIFDVLRNASGHPVDPDGRRLDPKRSELFYKDRLTGTYSIAVPISRRVSMCTEWENLPPVLRDASVRDGRIYGIPVLDGFTCIVFRKDLFADAGLDPDSAPPDWEAFLYYAQKLTDPDKPIRGARVQRGQYGFACGIDPAEEWLTYLRQAGGEAVHKIKFCPGGHGVAATKEGDLPPKCPLCGESLVRIRQSWAPAFDSDAGVVALEYYRVLRSRRWTRCPRCGEPVNLPPQGDAQSTLVCSGPKGCGMMFPYPPDKRVYLGTVRELDAKSAPERSNLLADLFERGEVAMVMVSRPYSFIAGLSLPSENIGMFPLPAGWQWVECHRCLEPIILTREMKASGRAVCPRDASSFDFVQGEVRGGLSANLLDVRMWSMNSSSSRGKRDGVWRLIRHRMSEEAQASTASFLVDASRTTEGYARAVRPSTLLLAGYRDLYDSLPKNWILVEEKALSSGVLPPWTPGWSAFMSGEMRKTLKRVSGAEQASLRLTLREAAAKCEATIQTRNPVAVRKRKKGILGILVPAAILLLLAFRWMYQAHRRVRPGLPGELGQGLPVGLDQGLPTAPETPRKRRALGWLLLAPALVCVIVWVYYPVLKSTEMAFCDWGAEGKRTFVGVLNLADILSSHEFWRVVFQTLLFVLLTMALGFAAPIVLALLLAEVPRGKRFFGSIFYLPALTSGLAVALLWKMMYGPTETGFLNWLLLQMPRWTYLILPLLLMVVLAALSAAFLRKREFIPGAVLLILCIGLVLLIPRIQPLRRAINWLGNPAAGGIWTMVCVVLPAVWASAGPGSMIYLAALRGIPGELYDSAELDGAGVFAKIRHITLAELKPLLIINLLGVVVGTSQAIRTIFVMTGGDPQGRTKVLGLEVWYNAFLYLRLGYATALAWILASMILGFTVCQLRRMRRADFRRLPAEA